MKRFTWIPVIASVVLLLIALPVFGTNVIDVLQSGISSSVEPAALENPTDLDIFGDDFNYPGGGGGPSCESSGQGTENPF